MSQQMLDLGDVERRFVAVESEDAALPLLRIEKRASKDSDTEQQFIVGYAARFGVDSLAGAVGDFTERIDPRAFGIVSERRGRKNPLMTRALFNHDSNMPLARYPDTLSLTVDDIGLRYEFPVPDTSYGRDLVTLIEGGIVRGSSFAFILARDGEEWSVDENGRHIRTITRVADLMDVGPVTYPAYGDGGLELARRSFAMHSEKSKKYAEARAAAAVKAAAAAAKRAELTEWMKTNAAR